MLPLSWTSGQGPPAIGSLTDTQNRPLAGSSGCLQYLLPRGLRSFRLLGGLSLLGRGRVLRTCTQAHGSWVLTVSLPTEESWASPQPTWVSSALLHSSPALLTSPPRLPISRRRFRPPPPFPACAAVRPLAFGFCLPPQDGGHNEPAPRRLSLRRL